MIKRIKTNLDVVEAMLYYWQATSEKEKVGEPYILSIANFPEMEYIYGQEFDKESVRKVLSAISNREMLNSESKKERKFWNNNMWMLEDLEFTNMMVQPVKMLNLSGLVDKTNSINPDFAYEEIEVVFVPGHLDDYIIDGNKLIINFFRIMPDLYQEGKVNIGDKDFNEYIEEKLVEMVDRR
ncbi:conserved hypothetical protein [[Clostridium] ultunense Esp]|uniref:Uncharacterized protein n=1 Tax=[Clostridium] ultunense Esp TaxID=1288971 RepID=M1YQF6_9FIRM|nr:hypothetical protein [Schnuerera ultunensis]CCQ92765.1 conserved hypothetical protein [[Clostridium] ultunense Esp]SHD75774.1 conserved protein of unknown function [[Clostridium] ultunense Esp]